MVGHLGGGAIDKKSLHIMYIHYTKKKGHGKPGKLTEFQVTKLVDTMLTDWNVIFRVFCA